MTLLPPLYERGLKRSLCKLFAYALLTHTFTFIYFFNLRFFSLDFINGTEKVGEVEERGREQRALVPQSAWAPGLQIRLELLVRTPPLENVSPDLVPATPKKSRIEQTAPNIIIACLFKKAKGGG